MSLLLRGIITNEGATGHDQHGAPIVRSLTDQELNYTYLYWDRVVIPSSEAVFAKLPYEEELLNSGVLMRPTVKLPPEYGLADIIGSVILPAQEIAVSLLSDSTVDWTLHQFGPSLVITHNAELKRETLRLGLLNALPVPREGATPDEILGFKERRRDELVALHESLDSVYFDILAAPDRSLFQKKSIANLRSAVLGLNRVTEERFKAVKRFDISAQFSLSSGKLIAAAGIAAAVQSALPSASPLISFASGAVSLLEIQAKTTATFEPAKNKFRLGYLSAACRAGILSRAEDVRS